MSTKNVYANARMCVVISPALFGGFAMGAIEPIESESPKIRSARVSIRGRGWTTPPVCCIDRPQEIVANWSFGATFIVSNLHIWQRSYGLVCKRGRPNKSRHQRSTGPFFQNQRDPQGKRRETHSSCYRYPIFPTYAELFGNNLSIPLPASLGDKTVQRGNPRNPRGRDAPAPSPCGNGAAVRWCSRAPPLRGGIEGSPASAHTKDEGHVAATRVLQLRLHASKNGDNSLC